MDNHNDIIFKIGSKVRIDKDYWNHADNDNRQGIATVIGHQTNHSPDGDFIDNILQYQDGTTEPFANWEIYLDDSK